MGAGGWTSTCSAPPKHLPIEYVKADRVGLSGRVCPNRKPNSEQWTKLGQAKAAWCGPRQLYEDPLGTDALGTDALGTDALGADALGRKVRHAAKLRVGVGRGFAVWDSRSGLRGTWRHGPRLHPPLRTVRPGSPGSPEPSSKSGLGAAAGEASWRCWSGRRCRPHRAPHLAP